MNFIKRDIRYSGSQSVDVPIARAMDVLSSIGDESDVDKALEEMEQSP